MKFIENHDLQSLNTFGLPARAAWFCQPSSVQEVRTALADPRFANAPRQLILGGGSNIILIGNVQGCVLAPRLMGLKPVGDTGDNWLVEAGAGEPWHSTVSRLMVLGRPGLENLALIPGTVGAAPIQNIGAYGLELQERFAWLDAVDIRTGTARRFNKQDCAFGYRDSVFKQALAGQYVITSVTFALPKKWRAVTTYADVAHSLQARGVAKPSAEDVFDAVVAVRRAKLPDPAVQGNAGSFFKNPIVPRVQADALKQVHPALPLYAQPDGRAKLAAGWLIDQCGFKGRMHNGVGVHQKQALVLVNCGNASGAAVMVMAQHIRAAVQAKFDVLLEMEPQVV
jgi:UDP-N-acetylmuramate dehydrogenase